MKPVKMDSLGVKCTILAYESVAELVAAAGGEEQALERINRDLAYRGPHADFREEFVLRVEEATGIERKLVPTGKKDAKGQDIMEFGETEGRYMAGVLAQKGLKDATSFQSIADGITGIKDDKGVEHPLAVDIKAAEHKPKAPAKLGKRFLDYAKQIIAKGNAQKVVDFIQKETGTVVVLTGDPTKDAEALGWGMKANEEARTALLAA